jgi:nicotinate dehydrogenase subunit B
VLEVERYELETGPAYLFAPDRRDFFKLLGGGIAVLLLLTDEAEAQGHRGGQGSQPQDIGAWLHIGEDNTVTVLTGKVEVGQNTRTALTQAVAEELHIGLESVKLVMGDTALAPYDAGTFGSQSTPRMAPQMRRVAATAREMLLEFAAEKWQADRAALTINEGRVMQAGSGRSASFGELTRDKNIVRTVLQGPVAKPLGESVPKINGRAIVTGTHKYPSDMKREGMLHGKVLRAPAYQSTLVSADGAQLIREGNFAGIVGANPETLAAAIRQTKAVWKTTPQISSAKLFAHLKETAQGEIGQLKDGWDDCEHNLETSYNIAYIAHTPLEPRAAVAEWNDGKLTVWTGTQVPFGVRRELAQAFQIPEDRVHVMVPDTGSGYGGKHTGETAVEAARLAKSAGKPVKLVWTRKEEFDWAYFRPAGVIDIRSGTRKDGTISAWEYHNYNSGGSGLATPYDIAHKLTEFHRTDSPLRQGSYRGLAATANHFARESHMDEIARKAGIDPLKFRLRNLKDQRMKDVLEAAADKFGWGRSKTKPNQGFGISCGFEKGGYVASCVEVSTSPKIKIERVVTVFECGAIVNPRHLQNQVEGAVIMGIGGALFEAIAFEKGKLTNGLLSKYRVPRFSDVPVLETVLLDRKDLASAGAGETPIVAIAPAVGNAIFDATGKRIRSMPLSPDNS